MPAVAPPAARSEVALYSAAVLVLGAVSAVVVPPGQTPDEGFSFLRACHVAVGHLQPEPVGEWGGGRFAPGAVQIVERSKRLIGRPDEKFTAAEWRELAAAGWDGEPQPVEYPTAAPYTFVPFLPQAAGVRVGRLLGLGPLGAFYAGRFANLLFGTALVALALALAPAGRRFLGLVALLPMTLHLFGSFAPEVGVIGAGLVLPAMTVRLALAERRSRWWEPMVIGLAVAWVAASKPPYLPVAAVVLTVPAARFGGQLRRAAFVAGLFAGAGAIASAGVESARPFYPERHALFGPEASVRDQTEFVKRHPGRFAAAAARLAPKAGPTYFRLFTLGWLDTPLDPAAVVLYTAALALLAAGRDELAGRVARWPAALAALGGLVLTSLSLYLWCAPVGGDSIPGWHGRYLLPLLPLGLVLAPGRVPRVLRSEQNRLFLATWAAGLMAAVALATAIGRYYVSGPSPALLGRVVLLIGVGAAASAGLVRIRTTGVARPAAAGVNTRRASRGP